MPRKYVRSPGTRPYRNYSVQTLESAVEKVKNGEMTMRAASKHFKVPFGTLHNRLTGKHTKHPGGVTILSHEEEVAIIQNVTTCADWGYPLTVLDLRHFTKAYLDSTGRHVAIFKDNLPGRDWALSMLNQHKSSMSQHLATNITRARALSPLDPSRVLNTLPGHLDARDVAPLVSDTLLAHLKEMRYDKPTPRRQAKKKKLQVTPGKSITAAPSSSSSASDVPIDEETSEVASPAEVEEDSQYSAPEPNTNISVGVYMLVKFVSGKRQSVNYKYVCVVQSLLEDGDVEVMGLRSVNKEKTMFTPNEIDTSVVSKDDTVAVLLNPTLAEEGRKVCYKFNASIDVYEK